MGAPGDDEEKGCGDKTRRQLRAAREREKSEGEEDVEPELVGETPEGGVRTEGRADHYLEKEQVLQEDEWSQPAGDVDTHVVGGACLIDGRSEVVSEGEMVQESAEE